MKNSLKVFKRATLVAIGSPIKKANGDFSQKWLQKKIYTENGSYFIKIDDLIIEVEQLDSGYFRVK